MKSNMHKLLSLMLMLALTVVVFAQGRSGSVSQQKFDVIIRNGTVYDGTGRAPAKADVGLRGNRIAAVGDLNAATAPTIINASGLAVAPGFINTPSVAIEAASEPKETHG